MWISAYIYHPEPIEPLLARCISPLVNTLLHNNKIKSYFFIRYWTKGQHIRLRLKTERQSIRDVRHELTSAVGTYFDTIAHSALQSNNQVIRGFQQGTLRFIPYRPEYDRYGGIGGVSIAHGLFCLSSSTVMKLFNNPQNWSVTNKTGNALQMAFLCYKTFFGLNHSLQIVQSSNRFVTSAVKIQSEKIYIDQKTQLVDYFLRLSNSSQFSAYAPRWLARWVEGIQTSSRELARLAKNSNLSEDKLAQIVSSYIHMNNNRLGIDYTNEQHIVNLLSYILNDLVTISNSQN